MLTFLKVLWLPFAVIVLVFVWLWIDATTGWLGIHLFWPGVVLFSIGALIASWCALVLGVIGQGSPHPFIMKTRKIVRVGPYRYVRNPMMWGIGAILAGLALSLGSLGLWFGFALFVSFILWFVPGYEEHDMERRFGEEYREYCRDVPRWFPRMHLKHTTHKPLPVPH